jgi:purine/pyrimidine-nucleoside phosphorylase
MIISNLIIKNMFKTNTYFDGNVMSIAIETAEGPATIGAMKAGSYEFGTSSVEHMTVVSGEMQVMLPGETAWKTYKAFETFIVPKDVKFKVKMSGDTSYRCLYV